MALSPTPNMGLQKPEPSVTVGPTWAQNLNDLIDLIDAHDHSAGKGARVTTAGLNLDADLSFGGNHAEQIKSSRFTAQGAALATASDVNSVYCVGNDLYYNNGSGAAVQITSGTGVVSTITGAFSAQAPGAYPYTVSAADAQRVLLVDTSAARTINLPAATTAVLFCIKDTAGLAATNVISLVPNGTDTIDGVNATREFNENGAWYFVVSDGVSAWSVATCRETATPAGVIEMYAGSTAPAGYLLCDGSVVSQTTYAALFAITSTAYDTGGEGAGNLRLPDMRQRFALGKAASGTGAALGDSGGAIDHTHSVPAHYHALGTGADLAVGSSGAHVHAIDHNHAAFNSAAEAAHIHSIAHNHAAVNSSSAGAHEHFVNNNNLGSGTPSSSSYLCRSYDASNDFSYDLKGDSTPANINKSSYVADHNHSVDLPNFTGNSAAGSSHLHSVDVPAFTGNASSVSHTHTTGDFTGRIGLVTGGVDGNAGMTSGATNPPFLTVNYIIKT